MKIVLEITFLILAFGIVHTPAALPQKGQDTCDSPVYEVKDVTRRAKITHVEEPTYTEQARAKRITGTVVLEGVFCRNGKVTNVRVIKALPYGLTERAVETTRQIQFQPAQKDGNAVSQHFTRECSFQLY